MTTVRATAWFLRFIAVAQMLTLGLVFVPDAVLLRYLAKFRPRTGKIA